MVTATAGGQAYLNGAGAIGTASTGGTITIGPQATGTALSEGTAVADTGASDVVIGSGGVGLIREFHHLNLALTIGRSGLVTSLDGAIISGSPSNLPLTTSTEGNGFVVVYNDGALPSGALGRRSRESKMECTRGTRCLSPNGYSCVDTQRDIFSESVKQDCTNTDCGGCALQGLGVDCTSVTDGEVTCVRGRCVVG